MINRRSRGRDEAMFDEGGRPENLAAPASMEVKAGDRGVPGPSGIPAPSVSISTEHFPPSERLMNKSMKLLALFALAACSSSNAAEKASSPAGPTPAASAPTTRASRELITRAQIEATPAQDAYDLVQRLRPEYLRERGVSSISRGPALPVV